jgi:hypothetical protein
MRKFDIGVATNGVTFIPNFTQIYQLVQEFNRETGTSTQLDISSTVPRQGKEDGKYCDCVTLHHKVHCPF